jgi:mono/diheme cytochrome c family protein
MKLPYPKPRHPKLTGGFLVTLNLWLLILLATTGSSLTAQKKEKAYPGAGIFKDKCVLCHGADGSGNMPLGKQLHVGDLRSKTVHRASDTELHRVVHDGRANMPPFSDRLSDEEIDLVIKYVRALGKTSKR